jgi:hypothetical protein
MTIVLVIIAIVAIVAAMLFAQLVYTMSRNPTTPWETAIAHYAEAERAPVVVSLTTTPGRLQGLTLQKVLGSVLAQDPAPQAIEINIPYEMKRLGIPYHVPQWLLDSPVSVHRCEDLGPATKYVSTLERHAAQNQDQKILVMDDDMIMPPGLVGAADASMDRHPDAAVCGHGMVLQNKGTPDVKLSLTNFVTGHKTVVRFISQHPQSIDKEDDYQVVDLVTGYQGFGVRPRFFDIAKLSQYEGLPPEALFVDDMVISARLAEQKVARIVVGSFKTFTLENALAVLLFIAEWLKNYVKPDVHSETLSLGPNRRNRNNDIVAQHFWRVW